MDIEVFRLKQMIRQAVKAQLDESSAIVEGAVHIRAIQTGRAAGKRASERYSQLDSYRSSKGEGWELEMDHINKKRDQQQDMEKRFDSAGKYWKKVFGDEAETYYMNTIVALGDNHKARITIEPKDSYAGSMFVVKVLKGSKEVLNKEFGIGIGVKENIARFIKKAKTKLASQGRSREKS